MRTEGWTHVTRHGLRTRLISAYDDVNAKVFMFTHDGAYMIRPDGSTLFGDHDRQTSKLLLLISEAKS